MQGSGGKLSRRVYFSRGNLRMGIPTFSLPSQITCPGKTRLCSKFCYARKAEIRYKQVLDSRIRNLKATKESWFVEEASSILSKFNSKFIRIHESGDFYSQEYFDKWCEIARLNPNKNFLAYSRSTFLDISRKPENLILYWSAFPDAEDIPETGLRAFVISGKRKEKIGLHPYLAKNMEKVKSMHHCQKDKGKIKCEDCLYCFRGKGDVIFHLHFGGSELPPILDGFWCSL